MLKTSHKEENIVKMTIQYILKYSITKITIQLNDLKIHLFYSSIHRSGELWNVV